MTTDTFKIAYQKARLEGQSINDKRIEFGRREISTLLMLAEEIGYKPPTGCRFLDLGCGDRFLEPVCQDKGWCYTGLDYMDVDFEKGAYPVPKQSIDIASSMAVIEHLHSASNFIDQIYKCLKPGGLVFLSTPNFQMDWRNFYNDPTHVRPYTPKSMEQLLRLAKFTDINTFPGLRCKNIRWYRGKYRFLKAFYLLPFRGDTKWPAPSFLQGHARSIFALAIKPKGNTEHDVS